MEIGNLYRRYSQDVYRFAYWLCGNAADAEDITSETFVRAWAGANGVRAATAKAYLLTIARNLHRQQRRRDRGRYDELREEVDPRPGPERQAAGVLRVAQLRGALLQLPEIDRAALLLRAQEALRYDEIADALGISTGAVKVRVHRARRRLTRLMDEATSRNKKGGPRECDP